MGTWTEFELEMNLNVVGFYKRPEQQSNFCRFKDAALVQQVKWSLGSWEGGGGAKRFWAMETISQPNWQPANKVCGDTIRWFSFNEDCKLF
jgi:hypothetical protein